LTDVLGIAEVTPEFVKARTKEEDEETEWKVRIAEPKEFCETLVSFANRIGGIVLLGVNKEGNIQGVQEPLAEIELKITNFNHEWCDPHVVFKVSAVEVERRNVAVIEVKEGVDKPYWLKEKGFMIRNGSSDRIMKRSEVIAAILGRSRLSPG
jgi:ATP-dependent DNA helicase RecG